MSVIVITLITSAAFAATIHIPGGNLTIQQGIGAAVGRCFSVEQKN